MTTHVISVDQRGAPARGDWATSLVLVALLSIFLATAIVLDRPPAFALLAALLTLVCAIGVVRGISVRELLSPSTLYSGLVLVHFGIPSLIQTYQTNPFVDEQNWLFSTAALLFVLFTLVAIHIGCAFARWSASLLPNSQHIVVRGWNRKRVVAAAMILAAIGLAVRAYIVSVGAYFQVARAIESELAGPFQAAIRAAELFPMQALIIWALFYYSSRRSSVRDAIGLLLLFAFEMAYWLPSGRKEQVLLAILIPLFARYLQRREMPSRTTILGVTGFLLLFFPLAYYYRYAIEIGGWLERNPLDIIVRSLDVAVMTDVGDASPFKVLLERIALLEPVAACIRLIEGSAWTSFAGSSYYDGLLVLVPRLLWPGKPDFHYGTEFGQLGGFIDRSDSVTSISVTFLGEGFLNFGWSGALVMGVIAYAFSLLYLAAQRSELCKILYLVAIPTLLYIGGTFALYFGGVAKALVFFALLGAWFLPKHSRYTAPDRVPTS